MDFSNLTRLALRNITVLLECCLLIIMTHSSVMTVRGQAASINQTLLISDIVQMLGPRNQVDFVAVIDRSQSVGQALFYKRERRILEAILTQYATVHPDYVRTSVITFSNDTTLVYDHISNVSTKSNKCDLFDGSSVSDFDKVVFDQNKLRGTELKLAFMMADEVLDRGRIIRPNVTQIMLVMTDGDYDPGEDPTSVLLKLKADRVNLFSLGLGVWLKTGSVRAFTSKTGYYGNMEDWENLLTNFPSSVSSDTDPLWTPLSLEMCTDYGESCGNGSQCYCDVDTRTRHCLCDVGYQPTNLTAPGGKSPFNCTACPPNSYKDGIGNANCHLCTPGYVTQSSGAVAESQCICPHSNCSADICEEFACPEHSLCSARLDVHKDGDDNCTCLIGWTASRDCSVNQNDCANLAISNQCKNGAQCYDKAGYVQCICRLGYKGRQCEIDQDDCIFPDMCIHNGTCLDERDNFRCNCVCGWKGDFCYDPDQTCDPNKTSSNWPTSTTTPTTTTSYETSLESSTVIMSIGNKDWSTITPVGQQGNPDDDQTRLIIIIVCSVGGALLLILIISIIVIVCIAMDRRRKRSLSSQRTSEEQSSSSSQELSPSKYNQSHKGGGGVPKPLSSNKYQDYWRSPGTLGSDFSDGGGLWYDTATMTTGVPSVPRHRPEILQVTDPAAVDREETVLENQHIMGSPASSMDGWKHYIDELEKSGAVESAIITKLDYSEYVRTNGWFYNRKDLKNLESIMNDLKDHDLVVIQGFAFQIDKNDGDFVVGRGGAVTGDHSDKDKQDIVKKTKLLAVGKTKTFMIIAMAQLDGNDGRCEKEVQWITDHITTEGY